MHGPVKSLPELYTYWPARNEVVDDQVAIERGDDELLRDGRSFIEHVADRQPGNSIKFGASCQTI